MLRRIVRPSLSIFARLATAPFVPVRPTFLFSTNIENPNELKKHIEKEIEYQMQESKKGSLAKSVNFFEQLGWKINYEGIQVELTKKVGAHNIRVLFNARSPATEEEPQKGQENQQQSEEDMEDFSEVVAYINKDGTSKWLALDFMVTANEYQMASAAFIDNYEADKKERKTRSPSGGYPGPELHTLDQGIQQCFSEMVENFGITWDFLKEISEFAVTYEQKFYIQWLNDLKGLV